MGCIFSNTKSSSCDSELCIESDLHTSIGQCERKVEGESRGVVGRTGRKKSRIVSMIMSTKAKCDSSSADECSNERRRGRQSSARSSCLQHQPHYQAQQQQMSSFFGMLIHGRRGIQSVKVNAIDCDKGNSTGRKVGKRTEKELFQDERQRKELKRIVGKSEDEQQSQWEFSQHLVNQSSWTPMSPLLVPPATVRRNTIKRSPLNISSPTASFKSRKTHTSNESSGELQRYCQGQHQASIASSGVSSDISSFTGIPATEPAMQRVADGGGVFIIQPTSSSPLLSTSPPSSPLSVSSLDDTSQNRIKLDKKSPSKFTDETILFTSVQQLCYEIISKSLLSKIPSSNGGHDRGRAICLFMFGSVGSGKGEIAYELVEHSALLNKSEPVVCDGQRDLDCPLYHHIDVGGIIVANIDARIREYNRLVTQTTRARKKQLALRNHDQMKDQEQDAHQVEEISAYNSDSEEHYDEGEVSKNNENDVSSLSISYHDNESTSTNPSISSDLSNSHSIDDIKQNQQQLASVINDDFNLITLGTKQRSILQLKLMKYFNSITSKWVFNLIQAEVDKLEAYMRKRMASKVIDNHNQQQQQLRLRDRVYLITLVPNQQSLFKSCLYLQQKLLVKELRYPYWAIRFERQTNIKVLTKERAANNTGNAKQQAQGGGGGLFMSRLPIKQLTGIRLPILSLGSRSSDAKTTKTTGIKETNDVGGSKTDEDSSLVAVASKLNGKLGPKFNENFAQQFESMNMLLSVRYNPTRDYKYTHQDEDVYCGCRRSSSSSSVSSSSGRSSSSSGCGKGHGDNNNNCVGMCPESDPPADVGGRRRQRKQRGRISCAAFLGGQFNFDRDCHSWCEYEQPVVDRLPIRQSTLSRTLVGQCLSSSMQNLQNQSSSTEDLKGKGKNNRQQRLSSWAHSSEHSASGGLIVESHQVTSVGRQLLPDFSQSSFLSLSPNSFPSIARSNGDSGSHRPLLSPEIPQQQQQEHDDNHKVLGAPHRANRSSAASIKWAVELELFDSSSAVGGANDDLTLSLCKSPIDEHPNANRWRGSSASTFKGPPQELALDSAGGHLTADQPILASNNDCTTNKAILFHEPKSVASKSARLFASVQHKRTSVSRHPYQLVPVRVAYANGHTQVVFEVKRIHSPPVRIKSNVDFVYLVKLIGQGLQQLASDYEGWLYDSIEWHMRKSHNETNNNHHQQQQHHLLSFSLSNHRKRRSMSSHNSEIMSADRLVAPAHAQRPALIVHTIRVDVSRIRLGHPGQQNSLSGQPQSIAVTLSSSGDDEDGSAETVKRHQENLTANKTRACEAAPSNKQRQPVPILILNESQIEPAAATTCSLQVTNSNKGRPLSAVISPQLDTRVRPSSVRSVAAGGLNSRPKRRVQFKLTQAPGSPTLDTSATTIMIASGKGSHWQEELAALKPQRRQWIDESLFASAADESTSKLLDSVSSLVKSFICSAQV